MTVSQPLTDENFWLAHHAPFGSLSGVAPSWLCHVRSHLPLPNSASCLEIGVVPGGMLLFWAEQYHYRCSGLDFSPRLTEVQSAFNARGVAAEFIQTNFLTWQTEAHYDLVYSCGFIEHFGNYQTVVEKHWALVRPGGLLLLTVPTMTPVQKLARWLFFTPERLRGVLETHNLAIMNLKALRQSVQRCPGNQILVATYAAEMDLWFSPDEPGIRRRRRPFFPLILGLSALIHRTGKSSRWYSPTALVLARKQENV